MAKFKTAAHVFAGFIFAGLMAIQHFDASPAGMALVQQYPKLSILVSIVSSAVAAWGVYYTARKAA